jgi:hypothetical protein
MKAYNLFILIEGQWEFHSEISAKGRKLAAKQARGLKIRKTGCWKLRLA